MGEVVRFLIIRNNSHVLEDTRSKALHQCRSVGGVGGIWETNGTSEFCQYSCNPKSNRIEEKGRQSKCQMMTHSHQR